MNNCHFTGRMVRDAEDINGGGVRFTIAVDGYNYSTKQREATFIPCVAFGKVVDVIKQYAPKGKAVAVSGDLRIREYEATKGQHAGHKVTDFTIGVQDFELLPGNNKDSAQDVTPKDGAALW